MNIGIHESNQYKIKHIDSNEDQNQTQTYVYILQEKHYHPKPKKINQVFMATYQAASLTTANASSKIGPLISSPS